MGFDSNYDRESGWGASETGRAARGDKKTYLLKRQVREKPTELWVKPFEGNQATENGNNFELPILSAGSQYSGVKITETEPETLTHPSRDYIFATTDALGVDPFTEEKCVVEVKLVGFGPHMDWGASGTDRSLEYDANKDEGWDGLPYNVAAQVTTQMAVHSVKIGWVFASIGSDVRCFRVERDEEFETQLLDACGMLWQKVLAKEDPPPGPEAEVSSYYAKKWSKEESYNTLKDTELDHAEEMIAAYEGFRMAENEAKAQKVTIANTLRILIGQYDGVETVIGKATNKFSKSGKRTLRVTLNKGVTL